MSDASSNSASPFAARTIAILVAVLLASLLAWALLSAYSDDMQSGRNGSNHALSTSAVGFAGVVDLVRLSGGKVDLVRQDRELDDPRLLILTPSPMSDPDAIGRIFARRTDLPTLVVLPKWMTQRMASNPAWVRRVGPLPAMLILGPLEKTVQGAQLARAPEGAFQEIRADEMQTIVAGSHGGALLARIGDAPHYVLSDPDLLNNMGLKTEAGAQRAMQLLGKVSDGREIRFDLTLAGFARSPNLFRLAFEPPFLPLTLCLALAAGLAVLHALRRFGPAQPEERAVAFGKRALAENGAALLRLARRRHKTGGRYAVLTRDAVATATGAPPGLSGDALDRYLDRLTPDSEPFTSIATRAARASDTRRLLAAARDLYHWKRTVTREH